MEELAAKDKVLENGPLEYLFNGAAIAKILDFLTTYQTWDYSESDVAKYSGVNVRTVQREFPKLVSLGLIKHVRTVGKAKMYRLDLESATGQSINKLVFQIAAKRIGREPKKG
jgi:hypothetical protein